MACVEAGVTAAQEVGDGGNGFPVVPTVRADREDQIAERDVFMDLFHGWRAGAREVDGALLMVDWCLLASLGVAYSEGGLQPRAPYAGALRFDSLRSVLLMFDTGF
jgi:hypothetical protein